jgi:hypothetical protein
VTAQLSPLHCSLASLWYFVYGNAGDGIYASLSVIWPACAVSCGPGENTVYIYRRYPCEHLAAMSTYDVGIARKLRA